jgi:hypothetical protein
MEIEVITPSKGFADEVKDNVQNLINGMEKENTSESNVEESYKDTPQNLSIAFYEPLYDKSKTIIDIRFKYKELIDVLRSFGFMLYNSNEPFVFVQHKNNIIEEVSITVIQKHFLDFVNFEHKPQNGVTKEKILEKVYRQPSHYFNPKRLSLLYPENPISFNQDTEKEIYLYYNNGFVRCSPQGVKFLDYKELKGSIWLKQKNTRDFTNLSYSELDNMPIERMGFFAQFMFNVSGEKADRFLSLCSIVGFLLHNYFDYKIKAPILTDSKISDKADGRTGKTLFTKALGKVRNCSEINGKDFDPTNKHKYQQVELGTQIVCLNDVRRNFNPEDVFNDITEGISVEKKNQQPYQIRVKTIITANKTLNTDGASAKDRFVEYEFSEHYSNKKSPKDDFGHWFFTEWDTEEWNRFDNLMAVCACYFLKHGLVEPEPINLTKRKLVDATSTDFLEFMNRQIEEKFIVWNKEFELKELFSRFFSDYSEYENNKKFTATRSQKRFLELYCEALGGKYEDYRTNNIWKIKFIKSEVNDSN